MSAGGFHVAGFFEAAEGTTVRCLLCHHRCVIKEGGVGACRVRTNIDGTLVLPYYGLASVLSVDPIEKKPLYHFLPGSRTYSIGYVGCNLRCPFCQNFGISQSADAQTFRVDPELLVREARRERCPSIAHTYSEPLVHAEFVMESMKAAREAGLLNVMVTNGNVSTDAAREILSVCDAVNVDLKAWDPSFYHDELGGDLQETMDFIAAAHACGVHVEVTTLVIPGKNDEPAQVEGMASFLASLSQDIPYHLSAYRPMYRYTIPATPASSIHLLAEHARRHLKYVYAGNILAHHSTTRCASCGAILISRDGYFVDASGFAHGHCTACGTPAPIRAD
jgi:pyruvate formate lyase activating enzyme